MSVAAADDHLAAALPWIAGHCRLITTNLPRGVIGVSVATQLLAALPGAWTLWIVHLLDEDMLDKIKKLTPPSQLRVCAPVTGVTPRSRGELTTAAQELTTALAAERAGRAQECEQVSALAATT